MKVWEIIIAVNHNLMIIYPIASVDRNKFTNRIRWFCFSSQELGILVWVLGHSRTNVKEKRGLSCFFHRGNLKWNESKTRSACRFCSWFSLYESRRVQTKMAVVPGLSIHLAFPADDQQMFNCSRVGNSHTSNVRLSKAMYRIFL